MHILRRIFTIFISSLLLGCKSPNPNAYFFISNTSDNQNTVDIKVTIDTNTIYNDILKYSNIAPDLQYTPYLTLPKGKYLIRAIADSGRAFAEQPINLDADRWIFISYSYTPPIDTVEANTLLKNFHNKSFIDQLLKGSPPKVIIYIMDKEPIHM